MRFNLLTMSLALTSVLFISACSQDKTETPKSDGGFTTDGGGDKNRALASQIKVVNQFGEGVKAKILIGTSEGAPFKGNFFETDANGTVRIPSDWKTAEHVTVEAAGYIRQTLLSQSPGGLTIKLNPAYLATRAEVKGQISGLPVVNGDKFIDFALVMPGMSRSDLLNFDLNTVISPYSDKLTAVGQTNPIPSNVSLPTQKESYIIGIELSKPIYRWVTPTLGPKRLFAARGRFPFKEVVKELQAGKPFYELINYFSIQGGAIRDLTLVNPLTQFDFPGNELEFKPSLKVQAPAANNDEILVMLAASDLANTLIPTDIKKPAQGSAVTLTSLDGKPAYVVTVVKRQAEFMAPVPGADRLSAALSAYSENMKPVLLPLVENPSIRTTTGLEITMPNAPVKAGINPLAISATISDLVEVQNGDDKITNVNRRWEVIGLGWSKTLQLPNWPLSDMTSKKRVEVNFIGSTTNTSTTIGELTQAATHVSHSSADF